MRIATLDIGTNSVLLLVAERSADGELQAVEEHATITRLGQGVDRTGELAPQAVERTLACLARYGERLRAAGAQRVAAVGTSALRDARGGASFLGQATLLLGARPEVISGETEARLTFLGALSGLHTGPDGAEVAVVDVGGGSTEVVVGRNLPSPIVLAARSVDVGAVRLTERHLHHDPPTPAELASVRRDARERLAEAPDMNGRPVVAVAGTATTLAAIAQHVDPFDAERIHGATLDAATLGELIDRLANLTVEQRRSTPGLAPARADVIVAGAVILDEARRLAGARALQISARGLRWGLARQLVGNPTSGMAS